MRLTVVVPPLAVLALLEEYRQHCAHGLSEAAATTKGAGHSVHPADVSVGQRQHDHHVTRLNSTSPAGTQAKGQRTR